MRAAHPDATIGLWAEDEHRLGLLPVLRRVWAPRGQRPLAAVRRQYEWLYVYGFVRPATGQSWWCLLPTVNAAAMRLALATFARDEGIDERHRAVLVVDQAGWHIAHDLVVPDGLDLVLLPAQSPELPPVATGHFFEPGHSFSIAARPAATKAQRNDGGSPTVGLPNSPSTAITTKPLSSASSRN